MVPCPARPGLSIPVVWFDFLEQFRDLLSCQTLFGDLANLDVNPNDPVPTCATTTTLNVSGTGISVNSKNLLGFANDCLQTIVHELWGDGRFGSVSQMILLSEFVQDRQYVIGFLRVRVSSLFTSDCLGAFFIWPSLLGVVGLFRLCGAWHPQGNELFRQK